MFSQNMVIKHFEVTDIVDKLFSLLENPIYAKHGCKQVAASEIKDKVVIFYSLCQTDYIQ